MWGNVGVDGFFFFWDVIGVYFFEIEFFWVEMLIIVLKNFIGDLMFKYLLYILLLLELV